MSHSEKIKRALDKNSNEEMETQSIKLQIARLKEQVKLLTIENNRLRNHMDLEQSLLPKATLPTMELHSNSLTETLRSVRSRQKSHNTQLIESANTSIPPRVCQCKGKCATKQCGCAKRNISCSKLCKCSSSVCQNQEKNNKEQYKKSLDNIEVAPHESLFSPDTTIISLTPIVEERIHWLLTNSSDSEGGTSEKLNQTIKDQETKDNFNPTKLPRKLTNGKKFVHFW